MRYQHMNAMSSDLDEQQLLAPIGAEDPCGSDLEESGLLASFYGFGLFGHSTPFDPNPDWHQVKTAALEALATSKDLRVLACVAAALLRTDGIPAFSRALRVAGHWLEHYWTQVYPPVDEDAILRRNALNCFADGMAIIEGLRRVPLIRSRQYGDVSLRDLDIAAGVYGAGAEPSLDESHIKAAFATSPLEDLRVLEHSIAESLDAIVAIDLRMRAGGGVEAAPTFDALNAVLVRLRRAVRTHIAARPENDDALRGAAAGNGHGGASPESPGVPLPIVRSREDATRALDAVASFFRQQEPSSPVPLLVERAKRLVFKDFLEVLADIAPEAVSQARAAAGLRRD
jgi:type VI secretion system protein ImpA